MKQLLILTLIGFICLSACKNLTSSNNGKKNSESNNQSIQIPEKLTGFINDNLPDLRIPDTNNYVSGWHEYKSDSEYPFYCSSDFNGDKQQDYSLLLINSKRELFLYAFITQENGYNSIQIDTFKIQPNGIDVVVSIEDKGEWESATENLSVNFDGIKIDMIEESNGWSYYYKDSKFTRFLYD